MVSVYMLMTTSMIAAMKNCCLVRYSRSILIILLASGQTIVLDCLLFIYVQDKFILDWRFDTHPNWKENTEYKSCASMLRNPAYKLMFISAPIGIPEKWKLQDEPSKNVLLEHDGWGETSYPHLFIMWMMWRFHVLIKCYGNGTILLKLGI